MSRSYTVPREMSHVFALVEKARRFSIFPGEGAEETAAFDNACIALADQAERRKVVALAWFHDNPRYQQAHVALETGLQAVLTNVVRGSADFRKDADLGAAGFIWRQQGLEGIFRCAVLLTFKQCPEALVDLFSSSTGPHVVQGANEAFRSAIAKARAMAREGRIVLLLRRDEVEVFAGEELPSLFGMACAVCRP